MKFTIESGVAIGLLANVIAITIYLSDQSARAEASRAHTYQVLREVQQAVDSNRHLAGDLARVTRKCVDTLTDHPANDFNGD